MAYSTHKGHLSDSDDDDVQGYDMDEYSLPSSNNGGNNQTLDQYEKNALDARMSYLPPEQRYSGGCAPGGMMTTGGATNTGPKGVKADFEVAKKNLTTHRMMERIYRERTIENAIRVHERLDVSNDIPVEKKEKKIKENVKRFRYFFYYIFFSLLNLHF
jgi:hypothetical protein